MALLIPEEVPQVAQGGHPQVGFQRPPLRLVGLGVPDDLEDGLLGRLGDQVRGGRRVVLGQPGQRGVEERAGERIRGGGSPSASRGCSPSGSGGGVAAGAGAAMFGYSAQTEFPTSTEERRR